MLAHNLLTVLPLGLASEALTKYIFDITKLAVLNTYNSNPTQRQFNHPIQKVYNWNMRGIVTYANGQDFEGGKQYKGHVVHLLLVRAHSPPARRCDSRRIASLPVVLPNNRKIGFHLLASSCEPGRGG